MHFLRTPLGFKSRSLRRPRLQCFQGEIREPGRAAVGGQAELGGWHGVHERGVAQELAVDKRPPALALPLEFDRMQRFGIRRMARRAMAVAAPACDCDWLPSVLPSRSIRTNRYDSSASSPGRSNCTSTADASCGSTTNESR